jgi:DNA repair exonuclease SbcCD ATPase subunit
LWLSDVVEPRTLRGANEEGLLVLDDSPVGVDKLRESNESKIQRIKEFESELTTFKQEKSEILAMEKDLMTMQEERMVILESKLQTLQAEKDQWEKKYCSFNPQGIFPSQDQQQQQQQSHSLEQQDQYPQQEYTDSAIQEQPDNLSQSPPDDFDFDLKAQAYLDRQKSSDLTSKLHELEKEKTQTSIKNYQKIWDLEKTLKAAEKQRDSEKEKVSSNSSWLPDIFRPYGLPPKGSQGTAKKELEASELKIAKLEQRIHEFKKSNTVNEEKIYKQMVPLMIH